MKTTNNIAIKRRDFLLASSVFTGLAIVGLPSAMAASAKMKIGVVGAGKIGTGIAQIFANAGYPVMVSARDVDAMKALAVQIGHDTRAGSPREAILFGDVVVISTPWEAIPQLGKDYASELKGKIVIDTCNANEGRDGAGWTAAARQAAVDRYATSSGEADQRNLPGTRLVKAFNTISSTALITDVRHPGELIGVPLASDNKEALEIVRKLVIDVGYEPVVAGGLSTTRIWDTCHPDEKLVGNPDHPHAAISCPGIKFHGPGLPASQVRAMLNTGLSVK